MKRFYKCLKNKILKISVLILIGLTILFLFINKLGKLTGSICLIRGITGIPCPSCGMSRAIHSVIKGDIINAFRFHPLFWLPFLVVVLFIIFKRKFFKYILISTIFLLIVVYILRMIMFFPDVEPMKYNEKSIFKIYITNKYKESLNNILNLRR